MTVSRSIASIERRRTGSATRSRERGARARGIGLGQARDLAEPERARGSRRRPAITRAGRSAWSATSAVTAASELDGGVVVVRHRAVAGRAGRAQPRPDDALLGHLDRVEAPAVEGHRVAADLVERRGRGASGRVVEELGPLLDEATGPVLATGLLVGDRGEDHVAAQVGAGASEGEHHGQLHRDHVLHVDRAAAPDDAVDELRAERVARPGLRVDRHDVDVARAGSSGGSVVGPDAAQAGDARAAAGVELDDLGLDPRAARAPRRSSAPRPPPRRADRGPRQRRARRRAD